MKLFGKNKETTEKKPRGKGLKVIAIVCVVALVVSMLGGARRSRRRAEGAALTRSSLIALDRADLRSTISASGTVESAHTVMVYSTENYPVQEVLVEVGDYVEEGQLLARLDGKSLMDRIESQQASVDASATASAASVTTAQHNYDQFKETLDAGLNTSILSAENAVDNAYKNYLSAVETYERYQEDLKTGNVSASQSADDQVTVAYNSYVSAQNAYDRFERDLKSGNNLNILNAESAVNSAYATYLAAEGTAGESAAYESYQAAEDRLRATKASAQNTLEDYGTNASAAYDNYLAAVERAESAKKKSQDTLDDYAAAVQNAEASYKSAQNNLEAARRTAQGQLQSYQDSLNNALANSKNNSGEITLRQLRESLAGTEITAPAAGTVTAAYATVGSSGMGLLFVIEDVDDLVISTSIKDYDVGSVRTGMKTLIKSDATGSAAYRGEIIRIAPTAAKTSQGLTDVGGDATFAAKVRVSSEETALRIGMSVRLDFILEEAEGVLTVPYDAVYEDADGRKCLLTAQRQEDGTCLLIERPVTVVMENDLDAAVEGEGLEEGTLVVTDPVRYRSHAGESIKTGGEF